MITKEDIDRFYKEVDELGLKFPVAAIAKATGHSKANVSKYLSRKLQPSESFLNVFNEAFQKGSKNVSHETQNGKEGPLESLVESHSRLSKANLELSEANKILAKQNEELTRKSKPEDDPSEIPLAVEARFSDLLELIAELGAGTRWKSKREGLAVLSKLWHGKKRGVSGVDTQSG